MIIYVHWQWWIGERLIKSVWLPQGVTPTEGAYVQVGETKGR